MAFDDLAKLGLSELVARQRERSSLWGFVHVPKTAGTSLTAALANVLKPYYNVSPSGYGEQGADHRSRVWEAVKSFVDCQIAPSTERQRAKWFSGHLQRMYSDYIVERIPNTRLFTFVRDPVEQVISNYRYCLTPSYPRYESFSREYPTLKDFVSDDAWCNNMTRYLVKDFHPENTSPEDVIGSVISSFQFIGLSERHADCASVICRMLGVDVVVPERRNVTDDTAENTFEISAEDIDAIRRANALDEALYRRVQQVLLPRLDEWISVSPSSYAG